MSDKKDDIYSYGRLKFDAPQRKMWIDGKLKTLPKMERDLLLYFVQNPDRVLSKDDLYKRLWGEDITVEEQQLTRKISSLRKKCGEGIGDPIENIPGEGYKFNPAFFRYTDQMPCPWIGLKYYDETNQDYFYGRRKDIDRVISKLKATPFLPLTGISGVGKSSLVRAGIIPELKSGAISGSEEWIYISLRPTHNPLRELSIKIASLKHSPSELTEDVIDRITNNLRSNPKDVVREFDSFHKKKVFLFVDQIEELLSSGTNKNEASIFAEVILELSKNNEITKATIINLRRDFYNQFCDKFKEWSSIITDNMIEILEMTDAQLKEVIDEPPKLVGLILDEGLSNQIVSDVASDKVSHSGVLPLLSNFLAELFKYKDEENRITFNHYFRSGGIEDSMSRYADKVFDSLADKQKPIAEILLMLLSDPGERPELDSCKPVEENKLLNRFSEETEEVQNVIQELIKKRILLSRTDSVTKESIIEFPHAYLVKNWHKIQQLLSKKRRAIRFAETIERKTDLWLKSGKNPDELLKGTQLETAIELYDDYIELIGDNEKIFFNASYSAKRDDEKRKQREKQKENLLRMAKWGVISLIIILFVGFLYFGWVNNKSTAAKTAADSLTELEKNPANALRLAVQAVEMDETPDNVAILQAAVTGSRLNKSLKGHTATLTAIVVSSDGKFLITSSRDNTARIWDRESGQLLYKLEGHTKAVECATFTPDGKYAVTSSSDETVRIWNVSNGKEIKKIESQQGGVNNVAVSPDGKFLLTAGENDTAAVWDLNSGDRLFVLSHPKETGRNFGLNSAVFSSDGRLIATGSGDKTSIIWDAASGKHIKTLEHPDSVLNLAFSPDGKVLITACRDGVARIWNVQDWSLQSALGGHQGQINCVAFDSTGERIATASMDRTAIIWDWRKGKILISLKGHTGAITSAVFSSDGRFVYTSSGDTEAGIWKIKEDFIINDIKGHAEAVYETSYSTDGKMILTASKDSTARLWKTASGELIKTLSHKSPVRSAQFSPDTKTIATATEDGKIHFWESETGNSINEFVASAEPIYSIAFDPTGKILASGGRDGKVTLWRVPSGDEINSFEKSNQLEPDITRLAFSPNGKTLTGSSKDRSIKLWDISTSTALEPWLIGTGIITSVSFGVDNNRILVSGNDKSLRVWDSQERKQVSVLLGHTERVNYAEFSPDGKFIVSASADDTIRIWSSNLQRELYRIDVLPTDSQNNLNADSSDVLYAFFSPDGKDIIYSTNYGLVQIIRCPICSISNKELISKAKERLPQS